MANYKNTDYYRITNTKTTVPAPANGTGTIETVGDAVKGTGTAFLSEMRAGAWLTKVASDEVRKVLRVESDTLAYLDNGFTVDIAAASTPSIINSIDMNIRGLSVAILSGLADGEIDGTVFDNGDSVVFGKFSDNKDGFKSFVDPIIVDAVGTDVKVTILR